MHFDDKIATVLAQPETDPVALVTKWRQLFDLLARYPASIGPDRAQALAFLRRHRGQITPAILNQLAVSLAGRIPADLAHVLTRAEQGSDSPAVYESPVLPDANRSFAHALDSRQSSSSSRGNEEHIRELVERLETLREAEAATAATSDTPVQSFRWETGADGAILWVEGAPRGSLVGQTIASISANSQTGVDGQAAGAFKRRTAFRDARFHVAGTGAVAGDWRISAVPFFDPKNGIFLGYRGSARRPRADEVAAISAATHSAGDWFAMDWQPDAVRQLVHELRTPLNAVQGFAEMVDEQYLGPASEAYRARAQAIRVEAARTLAAVDDLDAVSRMHIESAPEDGDGLDIVALLSRLHADYDRAAHYRNVRLDISASPRLPFAAVEAAAAERMCARLLAATIGLAAEGERLRATIIAERDHAGPFLCLGITRPHAISGRTESELLDPGYTPEGDWPDAPALGLGFALRLVRNLAEAAGGSLAIMDDRFLLRLPAVTSLNRRQGESSQI